MIPSVTNFILIIIVALSSILGNSLLRLGLRQGGVESLKLQYLIKNFFSIVFQPLVFSGFFFFIIATIVWLRVLSLESLNRSYPVLTSLSILLLIVSSLVFLREPLSLHRIGGMVLIVVGAFLVFLKS